MIGHPAAKNFHRQKPGARGTERIGRPTAALWPGSGRPPEGAEAGPPHSPPGVGGGGDRKVARLPGSAQRPLTQREDRCVGGLWGQAGSLRSRDARRCKLPGRLREAVIGAAYGGATFDTSSPQSERASAPLAVGTFPPGSELEIERELTSWPCTLRVEPLTGRRSGYRFFRRSFSAVSDI